MYIWQHCVVPFFDKLCARKMNHSSQENEETIDESIYKGNICEPSKMGGSHNASITKQR